MNTEPEAQEVTSGQSQIAVGSTIGLAILTVTLLTLGAWVLLVTVDVLPANRAIQVQLVLGWLVGLVTVAISLRRGWRDRAKSVHGAAIVLRGFGYVGISFAVVLVMSGIAISLDAEEYGGFQPGFITGALVFLAVAAGLIGYANLVERAESSVAQHDRPRWARLVLAAATVFILALIGGASAWIIHAIAARTFWEQERVEWALGVDEVGGAMLLVALLASVGMLLPGRRSWMMWVGAVTVGGIVALAPGLSNGVIGTPAVQYPDSITASALTIGDTYSGWRVLTVTQELMLEIDEANPSPAPGTAKTEVAGTALLTRDGQLAIRVPTRHAAGIVRVESRPCPGSGLVPINADDLRGRYIEKLNLRPFTKDTSISEPLQLRLDDLHPFNHLSVWGLRGEDKCASLDLTLRGESYPVPDNRVAEGNDSSAGLTVAGPELDAFDRECVAPLKLTRDEIRKGLDPTIFSGSCKQQARALLNRQYGQINAGREAKRRSQEYRDCLLDKGWKPGKLERMGTRGWFVPAGLSTIDHLNAQPPCTDAPMGVSSEDPKWTVALDLLPGGNGASSNGDYGPSLIQQSEVS